MRIYTINLGCKVIVHADESAEAVLDGHDFTLAELAELAAQWPGERLCGSRSEAKGSPDQRVRERAAGAARIWREIERRREMGTPDFWLSGRLGREGF